MDNKTIELNIILFATTPETREKGLMFSDPIMDDECAFFVFPAPNYYSFWNKNVPFGISLAFADEFGKIVDFAKLKKNQTESVCPKHKSKFVIETKYGMFEKHNIKEGDLIIPENGKIKIIKQ